MLIGVAWSPSHQSETAHIGGTIMPLSYPELLNRYEDLKKSVNRLVKELTRNGIVVNLNPQTLEVPDIHSSIFENKYYFDGYDVLLDFTYHDMKVINEYKNSKGDKEMEKSKIVETMQELEKKVSQLEHENRLLKAENENIKKNIENNCGLNFDSPLDFAKSIIEHKTVVEGWAIESDEFKKEIPTHERVTFGHDELIEIAEYLLIYCKHNKEDL